MYSYNTIYTIKNIYEIKILKNITSNITDYSLISELILFYKLEFQ